MKLYNTRTRKVEVFEPLSVPQVTIYTCGPTVYDRLHVGNWSAYIRWDILVRALKESGYQVKRVINITDVGHLTSDGDEGEDKLEKGARREGRTAWDIAKIYTDDFLGGMKRLNLVEPAVYANATDHIPEQIDLIRQLEQKGFTYQTSDGIYFDSSRFNRYADFAKLDLADQKAGARLGVNAEKKSAADFALWKFSPDNQKRDMEWGSPWGVGFPGWHIECSAMAMKYLGETIDIHTGGIDHIPVHHTNEIAQSEAATGKLFARFWLHNNFMLVDDTKMSKSAESGITLDEVEGRGFSMDAFKMLVLQSHYRTQSHFSWPNLQSAHSRLASLQGIADLRWQIGKGAEQTKRLENTTRQIKDALEDDLNTPAVLAALSALSDVLPTEGLAKHDAGALSGFLKYTDGILGLNLSARPDITSEQKELIARRETARQASDWAGSDELRSQLAGEGLAIDDTGHGPIWSRN